jgi:hypothetical protein
MQYFIFQYRPVNTDKEWQSRPTKPHLTMDRARAEGSRWANAMAFENCPVEIRIVELVSDGRGGLVVKEPS